MVRTKKSDVPGVDVLPEHWEVHKLKNILSLRSEKNSGNRELLSVYLNRGVISYADSTGMQVHKPSEDLSNYQNVHVGDFVLNNQQAWRGSVGVSFHEGIISPAYFVYKITCDCDYRFMNYLLRDISMVQQYETSSRGVGNIQRNLYAPWLMESRIAIPPLTEQKAIAAILDVKCAEIDALIADVQAQIDTLEQYKRSVITETVTKGLNPNVDMVDSCAKYIGYVPKHWKIDKLKYHLRFRSEKNRSDSEVLSLYRELGVVPKSSRDDNHNVTSEDTSDYRYVRIGDFVVNKMKAWQGSMAVSDYEGIVSPAYYVYQFTDAAYNIRYFHYLIRNRKYASEFMRVSGGIRVGQWDLPRNELENILVLLPPPEEQDDIASYLDSKTKEIEIAIEEKNSQVEILESYKKSLIFEYVTGKKSVEEDA